MIDMVREFRTKNKPAVGAKMPCDFVGEGDLEKVEL